VSKLYDDEKFAQQQEELAATADMVAQRQAMLDLLHLRSGERVIDAGCGNGALVRDMLKVVGNKGYACGVDNSEIMIGLAQKICPQATFLKGDATDIPVQDAEYDVLTTSQLLCFVDEVPNALREFYRILRPGGRLLILDTDWGSLVWNSRNQSFMDKVMKMYITPYAHPYLPRSLSKQLLQAGFTSLQRHSFALLNWERNADSYSQQTSEFVRQLMRKSPDFTEDDWQEWDRDLRETEAAGEYLFSLNRYLFAAQKP
jgi:ubiquinone/menaquinone biosynthesis C-methylase UbiE